ncbi:sigma-G-dependent sporulation-specific acid-soluble spore protein CsgA [Cytobacillus sp. S13-E01]|uniref:sigma-G-dependent sporulation-specific acid-soluble spore protein CsgA n=1 Tax=Cytobacillus sp. S13-E01 TaxID=3031326 RepID=UPI0023D7D373|nr:sigma-G-dependent sporulation-specific acid-soluble spore protein CsgA [Cytobacillus sp. S13-E01]MDF0726277.1 sigma-G-dependent sporulation-specific acid-soluble spore protein CsgA [Cytobacillus sp. S13-E01]
MEQTLAYLRESISNYSDEQKVPKRIYEKLMQKPFESEGAFVRVLDEEEIEFLNKVLPDEINYAMEEQDFKRVKELNEVYELLF